MRKLIVIFCLWLISGVSMAQFKKLNYEPIITAGYQQNSHSQFQLGLEHSLLNNSSDWLFVGAGVMATPYHDKWYWLPYADVTRSWGLAFYGAKATTHHIQPQLGISLLNFMDIGVGYAIPFNENSSNPVIKGFTFSLKIRMTNDNKTYLKIM
ncbi:hypothetical protein [Myroides sp. N17-2]|uniref:hypothetical protein n=1 Tax=Myroides sp. N17-2 TaxID=2030799 RepID=UPI000EFB3A3D|nr:hypothetical protein [Myroides sp. N17-2]